MPFSTVDLAPRIGTEIISDIDTLLSGKHSGDIRATLEGRGVLVFREINFTDEQQVAFTKTLGHIVDEGVNNVLKITLDPAENSKAEYLKGAFYWHIDGTMTATPVLASLLSGRRLSPVGGDTEFANTYAAYDDLPQSEKDAIDDLRVVHSIEANLRYSSPEPTVDQVKGWQSYSDNELPLVWKHRSGRKSLVIGATCSHVVGMSRRDSSMLLTRLREWSTQPQFVYQHKWKVGDLVIWDNTGTMHRATQYPLDSGRLMMRTKLHGEESFA